MQPGITAESQKGIEDLGIRVSKEKNKNDCVAKRILQILPGFPETTAVRKIHYRRAARACVFQTDIV